MEIAPSCLPDDVEAFKALVVSMNAELAVAKAKESTTQALIAHLQLQIAKYKRERFGPHASAVVGFSTSWKLQLEELEASAGEDDLAAEMAAARTANVTSASRQRPARKPFRLVPSSRQCASLMRGENFSNSPMSRAQPARRSVASILA